VKAIGLFIFTLLAEVREKLELLLNGWLGNLQLKTVRAGQS
jgi:hypothetical protein